MSEGNANNTAELAHLLWEKQGRPESHSLENWLEAEYRALPLASSVRGEYEADLRMRGVAPLPQSAPLETEDTQPHANDSKSSERAATPVIAVWLTGIASLIALGIVFSLCRQAG